MVDNFLGIFIPGHSQSSNKDSFSFDFAALVQKNVRLNPSVYKNGLREVREKIDKQ